MKQTTLKFIALSLSIIAALIMFMNRSDARGARQQNSSVRATQVSPQEKIVEQVEKNIKVLTGMPQSQLYPAMRFMAASLGFQCGSCHVIRNGWIEASADDKPEKQTARQMIKMVIEMVIIYLTQVVNRTLVVKPVVYLVHHQLTFVITD